MKTVQAGAHNIRSGYLILVNPNYPLAAQPADSLLCQVDSAHADILLEKTCAAQLEQALATIHAGQRIVPVSGYRTMAEQQQIYANSLRDHGAEFTAKYVAVPGHSEHQSGLAIDLGENKADIDFIRPDFPYTGICQKFRQQAADFGFIERYQQGKEAVTQIAQEPWHFRYVGLPHARYIYDHHLALEEYVEMLRSYPPQGPLLCQTEKGLARVCFLPQGHSMQLPDNAAFDLSGNNVDGLVLTLWDRAAH